MSWLHKYKPLIFLLALFCIQFLFVTPHGEFALNDDWVHTDTLLHWVQTGEFRMLPFAGPTFYVPILYGAALVKLFGFSFTLLRLSTLGLTLVALIIFFYIVNRLTNRPWLTVFCTLLLWLNPLVYPLTFTFMTDIPALAITLAAVGTYIVGFETDRARWFALGTLFGVLGFFTRQTACLVVPAAILAILLNKSLLNKKMLLAFLIPSLTGITIYLFLARYGLLPSSTDSHLFHNLSAIPEHAFFWLWSGLIYLGLGILPLLLITKPTKKTFITCACITVALGIIIFLNHALFPFLGNILTPQGIGPTMDVMNGIPPSLVPTWIFLMVTVIGAISGALLAARLHENTLWRGGSSTTFLIFSIAFFMLPLLVVKSFDRYFIPILALLILLVAKNIKDQPLRYSLGNLVLAGFTLFSITQTAHYLGWNKARWQLADNVLATGVPAEQIDAGYEWNGWHAYWSAHTSGITSGTPTSPWWIRELFVNNTENYIVSFSPIRPYTIIETINLHTWNPNRRIYLLKKPTPKS